MFERSLNWNEESLDKAVHRKVSSSIGLNYAMSMVSIATIQRMPRERLADLLLSDQSSKVAVVDVRDDDHVGGHIHGSTHVPSSTLDHRVPEIARILADREIVVFHCALSQQRGPNAALRYMRERETKLQKGTLGKTLASPNIEIKDGGVRSVSSEGKEQEVYVLDRGFVGWQEKYGTDNRLTDAYAPDIWTDYS